MKTKSNMAKINCKTIKRTHTKIEIVPVTMPACDVFGVVKLIFRWKFSNRFFVSNVHAVSKYVGGRGWVFETRVVRGRSFISCGTNTIFKVFFVC